MLQALIVATTVIIALAPTAVQADDGPKTLLTRIAEWQYPGTKIPKGILKVREKVGRALQVSKRP
jgi:hypothetical protein